MSRTVEAVPFQSDCSLWFTGSMRARFQPGLVLAIISGYNFVMKTVGMADGKNDFLKLIRLVEGGERVLITRHGVPVAQIAPPPPPAGKARLGGMRDRIKLHPGWDEPIDPDGFLEGEL